RHSGRRTHPHLRTGWRSGGSRVSGRDAHPTVVARAPGKIFLTGEYAVLAGAPALVAAVDRQAEVRIARRGGPGPLVVASLAEDERRVGDGDGRGTVPGGGGGAGRGARRGGGRSGADIAAAVHGGVVEVVRRDTRLAVTPRTLPTGLELLVGWTGEPASTVPLLRRFSAAARERPAVLRDLSLTAERAAAAVAAGDRVTFLDAV